MRKVLYLAGLLCFAALGSGLDIESNCKCWVASYRRKPCVQHGHLVTSDRCQEAGCCYSHSGAPFVPRCYRATGTCPIAQCRVNLSERKLCTKVSGRVFLPRQVCEHAGCCYSTGFDPKCYEPSYAIAQPTAAALYHRKEDPLHYVPYLSRTFDRAGDVRMKTVCPKNRRRQCGGDDTTRSRCISFGCCWDPLRLTSNLTPCFHANRHITSFPAGPVDLIILVDSSGSVGTANFALLKEWMKKFTGMLDFGSGRLRIGVVRYSFLADTQIRLGQFDGQDRLEAAIDGIVYVGGGTLTANAILTTVVRDFLDPSIVRHDARRILLLITDGQSGDSAFLSTAITVTKQGNVEIFGFGVGPSANTAELLYITESTSRLFSADFVNLDSQSNDILAAMNI